MFLCRLFFDGSPVNIAQFLSLDQTLLTGEFRTLHFYVHLQKVAGKLDIFEIVSKSFII